MGIPLEEELEGVFRQSEGKSLSTNQQRQTKILGKAKRQVNLKSLGFLLLTVGSALVILFGELARVLKRKC